VRITRRAEAGEICDPDRWLRFEVDSIQAAHPGFRPSGLLGLSTGAIRGDLDRNVASFGYLFIPDRAEQEPWVQMTLHSKVTSRTLATLLPGFGAIPVTLTVLGRLTRRASHALCPGAGHEAALGGRPLVHSPSSR
jgi:hypothetical protein